MRKIMREITLFLHSQKIQKPEPIVSTAIARLVAGLRTLAAALANGPRAAAR
jgi:hypothetical protein